MKFHRPDFTLWDHKYYSDKIVNYQSLSRLTITRLTRFFGHNHILTLKYLKTQRVKIAA